MAMMAGLSDSLALADQLRPLTSQAGHTQISLALLLTRPEHHLGLCP
jgi:hypothetical protein